MGNIPSWYKGKQVKCYICDAWYGEKDSRIRKKDGKWICFQDDDTLTEEERRASIKN